MPAPRRIVARALIAACAAGLLFALAACSSSSEGGDEAGKGADASRGTDITTVDGTATPDAQGGCADEVTNAGAEAAHVDPGTTMEYDGVPPVSGKHWGEYPTISKLVYAPDERPDLGELVHSQEHGWTIVWFDDAIGDDATKLAALTAAADALDATNPTKVVFVPWTADDGDAFPDGKDVAITHWSRVGDDETEVRQFCATASPDAIAAFMARHPYTDSREPDAP